MTSRPRAQCDACARLRPKTDLDDPMTCDAFPDGIPDVIWNNQADHRRPFDGDGGIRFEARAGDAYPEWALPPTR